MSDQSRKTSHSLSVDDFIALNDEIASLLKAGVPLDVGLSGFAESVSGHLSKVSAQVSEAVSRGESLEHAFENTQSQMPAAYGAMLRAGAESGRLSQAVEALADHARRLRETRRQITLSLIYPTIVILFAWCLFWIFASAVLPQTLHLSLHHADQPSKWVSMAQDVADIFRLLGPFPPIILVSFLIWILLPIRTSSRQAMLDFRGIRWLPGARKARRSWNLSAFTELSARLLQHGVPEPHALELAARTTADAELIADAQQVAESLQSGQTAAARIDSARTFPPLMKWMWKVAEQQSSVIPTFQQLSEHFQQEAQRRMTRIQLLFPITMTVFIAGGVVALYALAIFTPITQLMYDLGREIY